MPQICIILADVRVEQQQRHPSDSRLPDACAQRSAVGHGQHDLRHAAVVLAQDRQRQGVGVVHRILLVLPAVTRDPLLEVAVLIEQADADHRNPPMSLAVFR